MPLYAVVRRCTSSSKDEKTQNATFQRIKKNIPGNETFESDSDSNVSWDVCQNSSKSGIFSFFVFLRCLSVEPQTGYRFSGNEQNGTSAFLIRSYRSLMVGSRFQLHSSILLTSHSPPLPPHMLPTHAPAGTST